MDLTPFLPTIGVIVGALATLGGVTISARSSRKADEKRLTVEAAQEVTRLQREDDAAKADAVEAKARKQTDLYESIAQLFVGELSNLRAQMIADDQLRVNTQMFNAWFDREWPVNPDTRLRRVISGLTNDDHRLKITQICDGIMDQEELSSWNFNVGGPWVSSMLTLGFDLASTYARGQAIDAELQERWTAFRRESAELESYRESQREAMRERRKEKAAERRAKEAEAEQDIADLEAEHTATEQGEVTV